MATCLPYKSAWVPIISVPIIDNLCSVVNILKEKKDDIPIILKTMKPRSTPKVLVSALTTFHSVAEVHPVNHVSICIRDFARLVTIEKEFK